MLKSVNANERTAGTDRTTNVSLPRRVDQRRRWVPVVAVGRSVRASEAFRCCVRKNDGDRGQRSAREPKSRRPATSRALPSASAVGDRRCPASRKANDGIDTTSTITHRPRRRDAKIDEIVPRRRQAAATAAAFARGKARATKTSAPEPPPREQNRSPFEEEQAKRRAASQLVVCCCWATCSYPAPTS